MDDRETFYHAVSELHRLAGELFWDVLEALRIPTAIVRVSEWVIRHRHE